MYLEDLACLPSTVDMINMINMFLALLAIFGPEVMKYIDKMDTFVYIYISLFISTNLLILLIYQCIELVKHLHLYKL